MTNWEVAKSQRTCSVTGHAFEEGETYYSALIETPEGFARNDYCESVWDNQPQGKFFSFWRTKATAAAEEKGPRRLVIDTEAFYTFFANLADVEEDRKRLFRYLVALILVRKRILRLDRLEEEENEEIIFLYDHRTKQPLRLTAPKATPEQLADIQETLNQIFECQITPDDL